MNHQITPTSYSNQRILTTAQIAEYYGTDVNNINVNFSRNKDRFALGKHYFLLEGSELKKFKNDYLTISKVVDRSPKLYLWTEKGAALHAKLLSTDKAWQFYETLVDEYYRLVKEQRVLSEQEIFNQNFHQRCVRNADKIPAGYFLIAIEMGKEAWSERAYHVELQYNRLPDGSAGQKWPNHLRRIGWDVDRRLKVWCELPNGQGNAWAYPEEFLLEFRRWMRAEYKDHFVNNYSPSRLLKPVKQIG